MAAGLLIFIFGVALAAGVYLVVLFGSAFLETKAAPKKEMFWCDKHGAIEKEHVITFVGVESCPICFHERLRTAERGGM